MAVENYDLSSVQKRVKVLLAEVAEAVEQARLSDELMVTEAFILLAARRAETIHKMLYGMTT